MSFLDPESPGFRQAQAKRALELGWPTETVSFVHDTLQSLRQPIERVYEWGVACQDGTIIYRSGTPVETYTSIKRGLCRSDVVTAYADGSGTVFDKPAGIGVCVEYRPELRREFFAENIGSGTNNRAELLAIWKVLRLFGHCQTPIGIYSDSEYAIGSITKPWEAKANADLVRCIREDYSLRTNVTINHIKGHAGIEGNEIADSLSKIGRKLISVPTVYEY